MRLLAISGSRADWGYLVKPLQALRAASGFDVRLAVTGQHLEDASGRTIDAIRTAGFAVDAIIDPMMTGDDARDTTKSMARIMAGAADVLTGLKPEMVLVLGDRYEILACASAAMMARVPIVHLCGGDVSEGAVDDVIRHAVSKLAHLHFPTNADAARRLLQMGEEPSRVHLVGSTGLDLLLDTPRLARNEFFARAAFEAGHHNILVTVHPVTLAADPAADARAVVAALDRLDADTGILVTGTNADTGRLGITEMLQDFVARRSGAKLVPSLGSALYVNAMAHCDCMVGNSSSGLYEAPSMGLPTVNVGSRQDGRLRAASVVDCAAEPGAIVAAINKVLEAGRVHADNPYGDGQASRRIVEVLKTINDPAGLLRKHFHEASHG